MNLKKILKSCATLSFVGYLPAPGTFGTLATLPLVVALHYLSTYWYGVLLLLITMLSFFVIQKSLAYFEQTDPPEIVLDELIGCLITFYAVPISLTSLVVGFVLFRFFDIYKPFGINYLQKAPGAWGVILDDIAAGIISNLLVRVMQWYLM